MLLQDTDFFNGLPKVEQARLLGFMEQIQLPPGMVIFREGDAGDSMYIVTKGNIEIYKTSDDGHRYVLTTIGPGSLLGEMAVLTKGSRTATAVALDESELYRLDASTFNTIAKEHSSLNTYMMRILTNRLASTTSNLLQSENSKLNALSEEIEGLPDELQRSILYMSVLPEGSIDFISKYLEISDLRSRLMQCLNHLKALPICEKNEEIIIKPSERGIVRNLFFKKYDNQDKNKLVESAVFFHVSREEYQKAVNDYIENEMWTEACQLVKGLYKDKPNLEEASMEIILQLESCPEAILFSDYKLFSCFLKASLLNCHENSLKKLEVALEQFSTLFNHEQLARLYELAAEFCKKMNYPQRSMEYMNVAVNMSYSLEYEDKKGSGSSNKQDREFQLAKQNMQGILGTARAGKAKGRAFGKKKLFTILLSILSVIILWYFGTAVPFPGLSRQSMLFIGISLVAIAFWMINIFPAYIVSVMMAVLWVLTGALKPEVALKGFSNTTWLFMLGILGLGAAVSKSGLLFRASLHILRIFPKSYKGQLFGIATAGIIFAPLIPSATAKVALGAPISTNLAESMGFKDNGNGSAGLGLCAMIFFGYLTPFFLTGSYANIFAMSLLPGEVSVNFFQWLLYSLPALIIFSGGMLWAIITMFKPEHSGKKLAVETIDEQLAILGRFTREEIVTAVVTIGVIVMLMFQGVHKIDSTWIMAIGLCILVLGGVLDNKTLKNGIDWPFLIFIGIALSFVNAIEQLGLVESVSGIMTNIMRPFMINQYLFLTALSIIVLIVAFIINDDPALILFVVSMYPIFINLGINPWVLVFILGVTAAPFFFPYQSPIYLTAYYSSNEKAFTHKQGQKLSIIFAVVGIAAIVLSIPYWRLLGLMK